MKYNISQSNGNIISIKNKAIYDLQTLYLHRKNTLWNVLYYNYQYNISIKSGQDFLLNHVDSKLSLVVMYADLVGSYHEISLISEISGIDSSYEIPDELWNQIFLFCK